MRCNTPKHCVYLPSYTQRLLHALSCMTVASPPFVHRCATSKACDALPGLWSLLWSLQLRHAHACLWSYKSVRACLLASHARENRFCLPAHAPHASPPAAVVPPPVFSLVVEVGFSFAAACMLACALRLSCALRLPKAWRFRTRGKRSQELAVEACFPTAAAPGLGRLLGHVHVLAASGYLAACWHTNGCMLDAAARDAPCAHRHVRDGCVVHAARQGSACCCDKAAAAKASRHASIDALIHTRGHACPLGRKI